MPFTLRESEIELAALDWLGQLGYVTLTGAATAPDAPAAERESFQQVFLSGRLRAALARLNPHLPAEALDDAFRKITVPQAPSLIANNRAFHRMLVNGVPVEYARDGRILGENARLIDLEHVERNDWLAIPQFTVIEGRSNRREPSDEVNRRPDIVIFINGLPLGVIELKTVSGAEDKLRAAFNQLQTYKAQIPSLFTFNELLVISDGISARVGSLTADRERFMPWRTVGGEQPYNRVTELETVLRGLFDRQRLLEFLRYFITFEEDKDGGIVKKIAGYHQFDAVRRAITETVQATRPDGDRKIGVVWHTQGSGKSLTMAFYAGYAVQHPDLHNPTLVVLTDRNDLDQQLFETFARCSDLIRQTPVRAESRVQMQELLKVASGGVIFTTIQKFLSEEAEAHELLSDRRNIIVIADEAHRSQYGFAMRTREKDGQLIKRYGLAKYLRDALPNASFIGFTGTPIELDDANTRQVFGGYVDVYDIQQSVHDKATVPIYYEGRAARIYLADEIKPLLDEQFEDVTEGEEAEAKEALKGQWATLEVLVGDDKRVAQIAQDIVTHFENRQSALNGKAMIVCMSRRICVALYDAISNLRPAWHSEADDVGEIKVVMTGSAADDIDWQQHIRSKARNERLAKRFKDSNDSFKIVIVRDMWLTGFDAPSLHTLYVDKPMHGHTLMQAIARVNRVFGNKQGGLVVDYIGLAPSLRKALIDYTASSGRGELQLDIEQAVAEMRKRYEVCVGMLHGFDWSLWSSSTPAQRLTLIPAAQEHILSQRDGKERWLKAVVALSEAFSLAVPNEAALAIRDDVGFFQTVRAALVRPAQSNGNRRSSEQVSAAIRDIVTQAIVSDQVVDIFDEAGLKKPDLSILDEGFLAEIGGMKHRSLAIELMNKLLDDEIRIQSKKNLVLSKRFSAMLEGAVLSYQNRSIEAAQVIEELISLAREMRQAQQRGEHLNLSDEEVAFYDALETNQSAVAVLGDEQLRVIARELVKTVRENVTIDWTAKETVRAKLRVMVRRILRKYGYPPDLQEKATQTVLAQAELIAKDWVSA